LNAKQAWHLKDMEKEKARPRKAASNLTLILKEVIEEKY